MRRLGNRRNKDVAESRYRAAGRADARSLPVGEPERPVLDGRTAYSRAVLVLPEGAFRSAHPVLLPAIGVQLVVLKILEESAVDLVGPGLNGHVDYAASAASILRRVSVGDDSHLANRIE